MTIEHAKRYLYLLLLVVYDLIAVVGATIIALMLRFDYLRVEFLWKHQISAPLVLLSYFVVFYTFRLYRHRWSFAGIEVIGSVLLANVLAAALGTLWQQIIDGEHMPRSVIILTCLIATMLIGGQRLLLRLATQRYARGYHEQPKQRWQGEPKRTVILANERSAVEVLTALSNEHAGRYEIVGILDPDPLHHGTILRGIKVLGGWELMHEMVRQHSVDEVIIALNNSDMPVREYMLACCRHKVTVRMVPVTAEWLDNPSASRKHFRPENIRAEDLLHRASAPIALGPYDNYLHGKRVMVTGAGGSIGAELCRQIADQSPSLLILFGHGENSIHQIQLELQDLVPEIKDHLRTVIGDMRDSQRVSDVMRIYRPEVIFHAAAHKHVPLMEANASEAVKNNIAGTRNLVHAAKAVKAERFVLISTDKAVNPTSVMGATKFLCEEIVRAAESSTTSFITVRFGNVLGSRGSVLPRFQDQLQAGGPITITHPEMRRFFMTIPEAVSLVLQAGAVGKGGELFVLNMGNPVRIVSLAEDLIRLSGMVPYADIDIAFCGLRPGEKLSEELFTEVEQTLANGHERYFVVQRPRYIEPHTLNAVIEDLLTTAAQHDNQAIIDKLREVVPTFQRQSTVAQQLRAA